MAEKSHPSDFALDGARTGHAPTEVVEHLGECAQCAKRVWEWNVVEQSFVQRFPDSKALARSARPPPTARGRWVQGLVAAAALLVLFVGRALVLPEAAVRPKGSSQVEVLVRRESSTLRLGEQPLRAGDTLIFRTSSTHSFFLVVGLEGSRKAQVLVSEDGLSSLRIDPGPSKLVHQGVKLDDYPGPELYVGLLSDQPLDAAKVLDEIKARASTTSNLKSIMSQPLPFDATQEFWVVSKEQTE
ncbi:MAG: hypothetical protein HY791_32150 [Deltaproteobacteria bacterium]|nr:hypothetical protein [Deltaproteobacteria bacterium]